VPAAPAPAPKPADVSHAVVHASSSEKIPPEVAAQLDEAERALASGDAAEAIRVARRTLQANRSSRAYGIVARAFCKQGDLGNAKAQLPHTTGADRAKVLRACAAAGVALE
jgi:serine/threonine-protein kinase